MKKLDLKTLVKHKRNQLQTTVNDKRHHRVHKKAAWWNINRAIINNGWELTKENRKLCDEYATRVFGRKEYAPWLYFFTLFSDEFKEGWIPLNYYARYILPDSSLTRVSIMKTFSKIVLKTEALPDVGYYLNGKFYNNDFKLISISELRKMVDEKYGEIIVKRDNSLQGLNNYNLSVDQITLETFEGIGNCVIQYLVTDHEFFRKIVDSSTATIRIATVRNLEGEMEFRGSYLKLGRIGHQEYRSDDGIRVPVLDESGELSAFCYSYDFKKFSAHPDTKVTLANNKIPRFGDAVKFCLELHTKIPHFPIVGWDVTIDHQENIKLFEWNAGAPHPDIKVLQATIGPCFRGLGWEESWK